MFSPWVAAENIPTNCNPESEAMENSFFIDSDLQVGKLCPAQGRVLVFVG
jgi:hypothetical protein